MTPVLMEHQIYISAQGEGGSTLLDEKEIPFARHVPWPSCSPAASLITDLISQGQPSLCD